MNRLLSMWGSSNIAGFGDLPTCQLAIAAKTGTQISDNVKKEQCSIYKNVLSNARLAFRLYNKAWFLSEHMCRRTWRAKHRPRHLYEYDFKQILMSILSSQTHKKQPVV